MIIDFNTKNITILDKPFLRDELDNFTVEWKNGKPTYQGANGTHDDCVMSLAIANALRMPNKQANFKPSSTGRKRHGFL